MRKKILKVILGALMMFSAMYIYGNDLKEIEGIWTGIGNKYLTAFIPEKKKGDYCMEIKAQEGKAYFYVKKIENPISVNVINIGPKEYLFKYKNKNQYAKFDPSSNYLTFPGKLDSKDYTNQFKFYGVKLYKGESIEKEIFDKTVTGCLKYLKKNQELDEGLVVE